jgi:hypothetical protein
MAKVMSSRSSQPGFGPAAVFVMSVHHAHPGFPLWSATNLQLRLGWTGKTYKNTK